MLCSGLQPGFSTSTRGFSLIELLIVIAIVGLMGRIAFPSFITFVEQEQVKSSARQIAKSITLARSAAIKSGVPVVMCASSSGSDCTGTWSDGWLVFRDDDRDTEADSGEPIIRSFDISESLAAITATASDGTNPDFIRFNYRGAPGPAISLNVSRGSADIDLTVNAFGKTSIDED